VRLAGHGAVGDAAHAGGVEVFEGALPPTADTLRRELGWLGRGLSAVRDLDMQLIQLADWRRTLPETDHAGLDGLSTLISNPTQRESGQRGRVRYG
jgi:CHAD domain-containing protein